MAIRSISWKSSVAEQPARTGWAQVRFLLPGPTSTLAYGCLRSLTHNTDTLMPKDHDDDEPEINMGYPIGQFLKLLSSTGEKAQERLEKWQQVISGLVDGSLQIGSRTPVAGTPAWVTLEVLTGGFPTGNALAGGPLQQFELDRLSSIMEALHALTEKPRTASVNSSRSPINSYFLSDQGRKELATILDDGCFRIQVPEEGALLIATWLMENGASDRARNLIETIMPHFDQLRFYPTPSTEPLHTVTGVYVLSAGEAITRLRAKRPQKRVQQMNETIQVWQPLYDEAVRLFLETVEGDAPSFQQTESGQLIRVGNGQPRVEGGWPCRHYAADWNTRAERVLANYEVARVRHSLSKKPDNHKENFCRLRSFLATACRDRQALPGAPQMRPGAQQPNKH